MTIDLVDDLHGAEDRVGALTAAAEALLAELADVASSWASGHHPSYDQLLARTGELRSVVNAGYCRGSCQAGDCDEDCRCPAHDETDQPHWPCPDDPDGQHYQGCGCR